MFSSCGAVTFGHATPASVCAVLSLGGGHEAAHGCGATSFRNVISASRFRAHHIYL
jgi:hypothetical protein